MRKQIHFALVLLLWGACSSLLAQSSALTVLYTNSVRGITYSEEGGNDRRVFAGLKLPLEGQLRLTRGTEVRLLYQNKTLTLEGPGLHTMAQLRAHAQTEPSTGFLTRFWSFVSNSIKDTESAEQVEKYHRRYLTNARAGVSGFTARSHAISAPLYLTQALDHAQLAFKWDSVAHPNGYHFTITKETATVPVFSATTSEAQLSVDLSELLLQPSAIYIWQVSALQADSTRLESPMLYFSYEPDAGEHVAELMEDEDYQRLTSQEQQLYLLYRLEEDGLRHRAYRRYQQLSKADNPNVALYQKLFASFLARMDALEEAKSLIE